MPHGQVLSLLLALSAAPAQAAGPAGWDHPGFDTTPASPPSTSAPVGSLTRRWSATLRHHDGACDTFTAPIVAAGKAIAADGLGISAYDFQTGAPIWHYNWLDPEESKTPLLAVSVGTLIAASGTATR